MLKYQVTLESQTDSQARFVTLSARNADEARVRCEAAELEIVDYSLRSDMYLTPSDVSLIESAAYEITPDGKVYGPNRRYKAKLHQAAQTTPYKVTSVERASIDIDRLVNELARLQQDPRAWDALLRSMHDNGTPLAAVTGFMYGVPVKNQYDGTAVADWDTDTIKVALLTAHTENQDTHDFFDDVSASEITGTGYTAGGATLGSKTATYDTASDQTRLDAADTTWTTSTLSSTECVIYKSTGVSSTSPLIGFLDFGGTVSTTAGTFQITWDSTGIVVIDVT